MELVWPSAEFLPGYVAALERGWSADNIRREVAAREEREKVARDPATFLLDLDSRTRKGPPIKLPDGTHVDRLPGYHRWMWDGEFCGSIGLRWQAATPALPPHCLGHIGYSVVPWKRNLGYATAALAEMLRGARAEGPRRDRGGTTLPRDYDRSGQLRIAKSNRAERRRVARAFHQAGAVRFRPRPALPHSHLF